VRVADLGGRHHPLVLVRWGHPNVDDRELGFVLGDDGPQRIRVADTCQDGMAGVLE
jgi:hypothetical protein